LIENYFNDLKEQYEKTGEVFNQKKELFKLVEKFNSAVLVSIEVDTHKDAYMLFESLNKA
jgi:ABC-type enterochelin transport system substrate-binding protein